MVVGNGPSLNRTDLSLLDGTRTFGLNRIYLLFERSDFRPSYHVCFNETLIAQFASELAKVDCPRFVNLATRLRHEASGDEPMYVLERFNPGFSKTPHDGLWVGGTVTFVALQLAYFMGFERVVLVGVDHRFAAKGEPNKCVKATGDDSDHFDPRYFNAGKLWNLPDLETSEWAYSLARQAFEDSGRSIVDATVDGALTIFDRVDLAEEMSKPYPRMTEERA